MSNLGTLSAGTCTARIGRQAVHECLPEIRLFRFVIVL